MFAWIVAASTWVAARMRSGVVLAGAAPAAGAGPPCGAPLAGACALVVLGPSAAIASAATATVDLACDPMRLIMCYLVALVASIAADRPAGRLGAHHHAAVRQAQSMFGRAEPDSAAQNPLGPTATRSAARRWDR